MIEYYNFMILIDFLLMFSLNETDNLIFFINFQSSNFFSERRNRMGV